MCAERIDGINLRMYFAGSCTPACGWGGLILLAERRNIRLFAPVGRCAHVPLDAPHSLHAGASRAPPDYPASGLHNPIRSCTMQDESCLTPSLRPGWPFLNVVK